MKAFFKSICLIPVLLICVNCGVADSANTTNVPDHASHDGGVSDNGGAGGEAGDSNGGSPNLGGFAGSSSLGGHSAGGVSGFVGQGGECHRFHHHCDFESHKCS